MTPNLYDFRSPTPLPGDLTRRLDLWVADAARRAAKSWAAVLSFPAELRPGRRDLMAPADCLAPVPAEAVAFRIAVGPGGALSLLVLPRPLMLVFLGAALGESVTSLPADRELSPIEESLCDYLVRVLLLDLFRAAWTGGSPLALEVRQREADLRSARLFPPDQGVLTCTFHVAGPFGEAEWYWLLPRSGWLEDTSAPGPDAAAQPAEHSVEVLARLLPVELVVLLGAAELTLTEVERLQAGDLILLDQSVNEPLRALVSSAEKFRVFPGAAGSQMAVRVQSVVAS